MSMNLCLNVISSCGCVKPIDLYQTPTDITYKAVASPNPEQVYFEWMDSMSWDKEIIEAEKTRITKLVEDPNVKLEWSFI